MVAAAVSFDSEGYFSAPLKGKVTATLVIDFGTSSPAVLAGHIVNWSQSGGKWSYSLLNSTDTEYIFTNVSAAQNTAWSLMLACAAVMNSTTGHNLSIQKVYFAEYGEFQITGIEGVLNTNVLFWQYDVNGQPAAYGVQLEKIGSGDTVSWALSPQ